MARGNRHLPTADVRNVARGNRHLPTADVGNVARGNWRLAYGLLIFNDGAPDDDVAIVEGDDLARCDGVDGCMALNR